MSPKDPEIASDDGRPGGHQPHSTPRSDGIEDLTPEYENEHVSDPQSGVLRASVFGASDGLVSNIGLVMGIAGASQDSTVVVMAGVAGLLAGAFSMAAGEYVSMQTQREVLENELAVERAHIVDHPDEEEAHLSQLLAEQGIAPEEAKRMAAGIHRRVDDALDFHALFELGFHPGSLGEPGGAAAWSFGSFAVGAAIPVVPWLLTSEGIVPSLALSAVALLGVGGLATRLTGRSAWYGALRQLAIGAASAGITFALGSWLGRAIG